jgi:colanic acid biosynthesis protein WcaH
VSARLPDDTFATIVTHAPLVSIDLVLRSAEGLLLLGKRLNRPAQGQWFVPGGRVLKNELLDAALRRIVLAELGPDIPTTGWQHLGVYQHLYADSHVAGEAMTTHYVVVAVSLQVELAAADARLAHDAQHGALRWWTAAEIELATDIHPNTKAYLRPASGWLQH